MTGFATGVTACLLALAMAGAAHAQRGVDPADEMSRVETGIARIPSGVTRTELAYGPHERQRIDVYRPPPGVRAPEATAVGAPILVMVHGGGWMVGNKRARGVVDAKAAHWVARGWILVSVGYRLQPELPPSGQAQDVARALALVAARAREWGGDASQLVLMGHSAGAHLVALLSADPAAAERLGAPRWRATVMLDGAAYDIEALMQRPHARLYDRAFTADRAEWRTASPTARLAAGSVPMLAVCSSQRPVACPESNAFASRVRALGGVAEVLPEPLSHMAINASLGEPGAYTDAVQDFIARALTAR